MHSESNSQRIRSFELRRFGCTQRPSAHQTPPNPVFSLPAKQITRKTPNPTGSCHIAKLVDKVNSLTYKPPVTHFPTTDAADYGWEAQLDDVQVTGQWTREQERWHSRVHMCYSRQTTPPLSPT
uniref:Uncharacterized protein n=1 Tax=Bracon brevicornis TaxID=1563983 RepID=A0A6V7J7R6_9HYME